MQQNPDGGKQDTTEYSASKAPETRKEAEEKESQPDARLLPGGTAGSPVDVGMSSVDHPGSGAESQGAPAGPGGGQSPVGGSLKTEAPASQEAGARKPEAGSE